MQSYEMHPIGIVHSAVTDRVEDVWGDVTATIVLDERFGPEPIAALGDFSHAIVVYVFDQIDEVTVETGSRSPRNNPAWPQVGIFAQRGSRRPNRIGVTIVEIVAVRDRTVTVRRLEAIDATPVLDIKPYFREFEPAGTTRQPDWTADVMREYWQTRE